MGADELAFSLCSHGRSQLRDGNRRGIAGDDGRFLADGIQLFEDALFLCQRLPALPR